MPTPLEVELKTYAHELVAVYVKGEYDSQIRKWQQYINQMVDAQKEALDSQIHVLNAAREQIEAEKQAVSGLAMLALSLVSGPVLAWVGSKIQYAWFPKYNEKLAERWLRVRLRRKDPFWTMVNEQFYTHDEVWAQVFGQVGQQIAGLGIDKVIKVAVPGSTSAQNAIQTAASSDQGSFKTRLENAMLAEADLTSTAIMNVGMSILQNSSYGAECLQKLIRVNPRATSPKVTEQDLEAMAKEMIRNDINKQRQQWADKWFYYGNDPVQSAGMARSIEMELWGLWILNEKLRLVGGGEHKSQRGRAGESFSVPFGVAGATFGDPGVPEGVLIRLAELGAVARTRFQKLSGAFNQGVKNWQEAVPWEVLRDQEVAARARVVQQQNQTKRQEQSEDLEDSGAKYPDLARFNRTVTRVANKNGKDGATDVAKTPAKQDPDRPLIPENSWLSTQSEINALESWALNHQPRLGSGQLPYRKRTLQSIENIYREQ